MKLLQVLAIMFTVLEIALAHGGHGESGKPLEFSSEIHNKDHILEHLSHVVATKPKDQLTDEELEFHYFKLHDYDHNNKLDGVEIGKALTHFHDGAEPDKEKFSFSDEDLEGIIEEALKDDLDGDGYVEYYEFSLSQQLARSANPHLSQSQHSTQDSGLRDGKPPSWKFDKIKPPSVSNAAAAAAGDDGEDDDDDDFPAPVENIKIDLKKVGNNVEPQTIQQEIQSQKLNDFQNHQQHQPKQQQRNPPPTPIKHARPPVVLT